MKSNDETSRIFARYLPCKVRDEAKDVAGDLEKTHKAVKRAEIRAQARHRHKGSKVERISNKRVADVLHREADQKYYTCDYETALILYHKAASVWPRDTKHIAAVRKAILTINMWSNHLGSFDSRMSKMKDEQEVAAKLYPESAAIKAMVLLKNSHDPASVVSEALRYFDNHKNFWRVKPSMAIAKIAHRKSPRSTMLNGSQCLGDLSLKSLDTNFNAGNVSAVLKLSNELLVVSSGLDDSSYYQVAAYYYISLCHVSLGRHDRAVSTVHKMMYTAKTTKDVRLIARSLITIGKVHLSFGHLNAAARAWTNQAKYLQYPMLQAWLYHEIGRCYLETGRYRLALEIATRCLTAAKKADSKKWILYSKLLSGQVLIKLGRLSEALEILTHTIRISEEQCDATTLVYVKDLINQIENFTRRIVQNRIKRINTVPDNQVMNTERCTYENLENTNICGRPMTLKLPKNVVMGGIYEKECLNFVICNRDSLKDIETAEEKENAPLCLTERFHLASIASEDMAQCKVPLKYAWAEEAIPSSNNKIGLKELVNEPSIKC